jgi:hypothetical protein
MMKLTAFRIRNFRSILDTGWQTLSPDNVTCLIGQNESGKTSILKVFYTGIITEDVLRSDLSLPEVSCRFSIPEGWLLKVTDNPGTELKELLSGLSHIELTRVWIADLSSVIVVSGEISQYLDSLEDAWRLYLGDVICKLDQELKQIGDIENELAEIATQESEIKSKLPPGEKGFRSFRLFGRKADEQSTETPANLPLLRSQLNEFRKRREEITTMIQGKHAVRKAGDTWSKLQERYNSLDRHLDEISLKLEERHQKMTLLIRPAGDNEDAEWKEILEDYRRTRTERDVQKAMLERHVAQSGYIMDGSSEEEAERKVNDIIQSYKS